MLTLETGTSVKNKALEKNENIVVTGCPCHISHKTASRGSTEFDTEDHNVDVFAEFHEF